MHMNIDVEQGLEVKKNIRSIALIEKLNEMVLNGN